jgi:hypothetical protein
MTLSPAAATSTLLSDIFFYTYSRSLQSVAGQLQSLRYICNQFQNRTTRAAIRLPRKNAVVTQDFEEQSLYIDERVGCVYPHHFAHLKSKHFAASNSVTTSSNSISPA